MPSCSGRSLTPAIGIRGGNTRAGHERAIMMDGIEGKKASPVGRASRDRAFEVAFGQRLKAVRIAAMMSQTALGEAIGVSFQQVQKYELGRDRVSVSTLPAIAKAFGVHPGSFFDDEVLDLPISLRDMREAQRIGERIAQLNDPVLVRRLLALVEALAQAEGTRTTGATNTGDFGSRLIDGSGSMRTRHDRKGSTEFISLPIAADSDQINETGRTGDNHGPTHVGARKNGAAGG